MNTVHIHKKLQYSLDYSLHVSSPFLTHEVHNPAKTHGYSAHTQESTVQPALKFTRKFTFLTLEVHNPDKTHGYSAHTHETAVQPALKFTR